MTLSGKRRNFQQESFIEFGKSIGLNDKQVLNIIEKFLGKRKVFNESIETSFLSDAMKDSYKEIVSKRFNQIQ